MIIEQLRKQPIFQIVWSALILVAISLMFLISGSDASISLGPFLDQPLFEFDHILSKLLVFIMSFILLFASLLRLSSLLRNYHFTGDSRFDMLFLLLPFVILFSNLLFHLDHAIFIYLLLRALELQFIIHTQIRINKEIALIALCMSFASLLFPKALIIAFLLYLGILIQRGFYLKELFIYLIVISLPYYFIFSFVYLFDLPYHFQIDVIPSIPESYSLEELSISRIMFVLLGVLILVKSFSKYSRAVLRSKAQFRNFFNLLLIGLLVYFFYDMLEGVSIAFLSVFAIFATTYEELNRKWIYELLLILVSIGSMVEILIQG